MFTIRIISVLVIIFIFYINSDFSTFNMMFVLPFSKDKISLFYNFPADLEFNEESFTEVIFSKSNIEIQSFLNSLKVTDNYIGYFTVKYSGNFSYITLTELILFNKYSNSETIEDFLESIISYQEDFIRKTFLKKSEKFNNKNVEIKFYYTKIIRIK